MIQVFFLIRQTQNKRLVPAVLAPAAGGQGSAALAAEALCPGSPLRWARAAVGSTDGPHCRRNVAGWALPTVDCFVLSNSRVLFGSQTQASSDVPTADATFCAQRWAPSGTPTTPGPRRRGQPAPRPCMGFQREGLRRTRKSDLQTRGRHHLLRLPERQVISFSLKLHPVARPVTSGFLVTPSLASGDLFLWHLHTLRRAEQSREPRPSLVAAPPPPPEAVGVQAVPAAVWFVSGSRRAPCPAPRR